MQNGAGFYDKTVNFLFGSKLRDGEKHGILRTKNGWRAASYMGPGTDLIHNIRSGIEPLTEVDRVAQAHDIRYAFSRSAEDVRAADLKMIEKTRDIRRAGTDHWFNTAQASLIRPKVWLEDKGLLRRTAFNDYTKPKTYSAEDEAMMRGKLDELTQKGYGKKKHVCSYRGACWE